MGGLFLLLLILPNLLWVRRQPEGYTAAGESGALRAFERVGEVLTSAVALFSPGLNWHGWSWWFAGAAVLMVLYELWWVRYFRSERSLADFYGSFLGIPIPGAVLPVAAFFLLGLYGRVVLLLIATGVLGVGHIGIHWGHRMELRSQKDGGERPSPGR